MIEEGGNAQALMEVGVVVGDRGTKEDQVGVEGGQAVVRQLHGLSHMFVKGERGSEEVV